MLENGSKKNGGMMTTTRSGKTEKRKGKKKREKKSIKMNGKTLKKMLSVAKLTILPTIELCEISNRLNSYLKQL